MNYLVGIICIMIICTGCGYYLGYDNTPNCFYFADNSGTQRSFNENGTLLYENNYSVPIVMCNFNAHKMSEEELSEINRSTQKNE